MSNPQSAFTAMYAPINAPNPKLFAAKRKTKLKLFMQILLILCLITVIALQVAKGFFNAPGVAAVCPVQAISMNNGKAVIDSSRCIGCRRCVDGIEVLTKREPPPVAISPLKEAAKPDSVSQITPLPVVATTSEKPQSKPSAPPSKANHSAFKTHKVNAAKCIGCALCVPNCPTEAITMVNGKAVIDKEKCINCGICVTGNRDDFAGCPVSAISAP